jgi:hypothetical protein
MGEIMTLPTGNDTGPTVAAAAGAFLGSLRNPNTARAYTLAIGKTATPPRRAPAAGHRHRRRDRRSPRTAVERSRRHHLERPPRRRRGLATHAWSGPTRPTTWRQISTGARTIATIIAAVRAF